MDKVEKVIKGFECCLKLVCSKCPYNGLGEHCLQGIEEDAFELLKNPSKEIGYNEKADALLKMWMDDDITDYEYGKIMVRLNKKVQQ